MAGDFADGVAFVPLRRSRDPALVCGTIAQALGVRESGEPPQSTAWSPPGRRLLLFLDNFEHLVRAGPARAELLAACPAIKGWRPAGQRYA